MKLKSALVALLALLAFKTATACVCIGMPPFAEIEKNGFTSYMFHGRVTRIIGPRVAEVEVIEAFSGTGGSKILIASGGGDCSFDFVPGQNAVYSVKYWRVHLCSIWAASPENLAQLRALSRRHWRERSWWQGHQIELGISFAGMLLLAGILARSRLVKARSS